MKCLGWLELFRMGGLRQGGFWHRALDDGAIAWCTPKRRSPKCSLDASF
jgi:hypothetical protein